MSIVTALLAILIGGLIGGGIAKRLGQPLLLGYILAGVTISLINSGANGIVIDQNQLQGLSDIGVALLLFSMGLEFSLDDIRPVRKLAVWGSIIQVFATLLCVFGILKGFFGIAGYPALFASAAFVSTSTAVVLKSLTMHNRMMTLSGRSMIGVSLVQDLIVIPLMVLLMNANNLNEGFMNALKPVGIGAAFVTVLFLVGPRIIPPILRHVSSWNSQELFLLCVTVISLGIGFLADKMCLTFSFGAFMAGILLNGSDYGKKALYEMLPVRDLFSMLFFVSIGMLMNVPFLMKHFWVILLLVVLTGLSRTFFLAVLAWLFKYRNVIPAAMFFGMFPTSEIAFIVLSSGYAAGILTQDLYMLMLCTVICSMVFGPPVSSLTTPAYDYLRKHFPTAVMNTFNMPEPALANHIILAGGGRVQRVVAKVMEHFELPYIIIEPNYFLFNDMRKDGFECIFGSPSEEVILKAAAVGRARMIIAAAQEFKVNTDIIRNARLLNPDIKIVSQAYSQEEADAMHEYKVFDVMRPVFELGLDLSRLALHKLDYSMVQIQNNLQKMRDQYSTPLMLSQSDAKRSDNLSSFVSMVDFKWMEIGRDSELANHTFSGKFKEIGNIHIVGVIRGNDMIPNPDEKFIFLDGDLLAVIAPDEDRHKFAALLGNAG